MSNNNIQTVLSWDIGVKNLSYCVLQRVKNGCFDDQRCTKQGYHIKDWDLINLYEEDIIPDRFCGEKTKKSKICGRKAKYCLDDVYFCKIHMDDKATVIKKPKRSKRSKRSPFEYAKRIKKALDERPDLLKVDYVIIENQPSQLNPVMKSVQMLLFSYFSYHYGTDKAPDLLLVRNVNARQKEKLPIKDNDWLGSSYEATVSNRFTKVKSRYARRKILCLEYAKMCLENMPEYLSYLENHKKQDDLTDCFLQATDWFLRN